MLGTAFGTYSKASPELQRSGLLQTSPASLPLSKDELWFQFATLSATVPSNGRKTPVFAFDRFLRILQPLLHFAQATSHGQLFATMQDDDVLALPAGLEFLDGLEIHNHRPADA
jgi:hypothetical protein